MTFEESRWISLTSPLPSQVAWPSLHPTTKRFPYNNPIMHPLPALVDLGKKAYKLLATAERLCLGKPRTSGGKPQHLTPMIQDTRRHHGIVGLDRAP